MMSENKIIQQYLDTDQKLVTEWSDGSMTYTIPEQGKEYRRETVQDQFRRAETRMGLNNREKTGAGGYTAKTDFGKKINETLDENERLKAQVEQMRKDEMAVQSAMDGGGKLKLPSEHRRRQFKTAGDMINSLYDCYESGDKEAGRKLDQLWSIPSIKDGILALEKQGFSMSECIRCHGPIISGVDGRKCPNCNFDYSAKDREGFTLFV